MINKLNVITIAFTFLIISCADESGDKVDCPVCDNKTEILVGTKCVAVEEVEVCGPDGHLHGENCHCFSDQTPTEIDGNFYCLQTGCGGDKTECSGHGHLEDGACHCDEGYEQDHDDKTKCVEEHEHDAECSGHGHLEDGACHCDEGYEQDHDDKTKCVEDHDH